MCNFFSPSALSVISVIFNLTQGSQREIFRVFLIVISLLMSFLQIIKQRVKQMNGLRRAGMGNADTTPLMKKNKGV